MVDRILKWHPLSPTVPHDCPSQSGGTYEYGETSPPGLDGTVDLKEAALSLTELTESGEPSHRMGREL